MPFRLDPPNFPLGKVAVRIVHIKPLALAASLDVIAQTDSESFELG
jgi:hypothetical protein